MMSKIQQKNTQQSGAVALGNTSGVQVALDNMSASVDNMFDAAQNQKGVFSSAFYANSDIYPASEHLTDVIANQPSSQQEPKRRVQKVTSVIKQAPYGTPWRPATRIVASGRQTIALCPDREQSLLAPPNGLTRSIADPEAFESNQRQTRADKLAKSNSVIFVSTINQGRQTRKYSTKSPQLGGGYRHKKKKEKALVARLAKKKRTLTRKKQRDLKSENHKNNDLCNDRCNHCGDEFTPATNHLEPYCPTCVKFSNNGTCELEYEEEHLRQTFYMTLSVINKPGNHAMPLPCIWQPWFSQAFDDNKSSKGYMLLMRTHARNIGAEFNADYLSYTYWLQSNPGEMTHAAYFDYPYEAMYGVIYDAWRDVNTDLLLKFQDRQCAICLEKIDMNCCIKGCNADGGKRHLFHATCLESWIEYTSYRNCPSCRGELFFPLYQYLDGLLLRGRVRVYTSPRRNYCLGGLLAEQIWTWVPCSKPIRTCPNWFAEEPAEESKSEPAETIQQCLNRMANETDDQQFKHLLIVYSLEVQAAYEVYLEDRDWEEFKDTCRHCVFHWREREHSPAALEERRQIQLCLNRMANETNDQGLKDILDMPDDDVVYAAYHDYLENNSWEQFKDICTGFLADFVAEEERRHLEYLDHQANVNGEYYETDDETDSAEEEDRSWGDTTDPYKGRLVPAQSEPAEQAYFQRVALRAEEDHEETPEGSREPTQSEPAEHAEPAADVMPAWAIKMDKEGRLRQKKLAAPQQAEETLQQCLIRLADETNDTGYLYNGFSSFRLVPSNRGAQTAYEVYLVDRNWEEFKDTCTRFLGYFRENIGNTRFNEEPAHSERVESEARSSFWDEETPEQLLVEDIQQCCIRLAHETKDQWFEQDLYQYNSLCVEVAYAVYLEDRNWEKFKDTCTRILVHFRAEYDDYETDPEDKAADLDDY